MDPATLVIIVGSALTVGAIVAANQASLAAGPAPAPSPATIQRPFTQPIAVSAVSSVSPAPTGYMQSLPAPAPAPVYIFPAPAMAPPAPAPASIAPAPPPVSFPTPTPMSTTLYNSSNIPFPFADKNFITTLYTAITTPTPQGQALIAVQKAAMGNSIKNFFLSYPTAPIPPAVVVIPACNAPGYAINELQLTTDDVNAIRTLTYSEWTATHLGFFKFLLGRNGYTPASDAELVTLINQMFTVAFELASLGI